MFKVGSLVLSDTHSMCGHVIATDGAMSAVRFSDGTDAFLWSEDLSPVRKKDAEFLLKCAWELLRLEEEANEELSKRLRKAARRK